MFDNTIIQELWWPFSAKLSMRNQGSKSYDFLDLEYFGESVAKDWRDLVHLCQILNLFIRGQLYKGVEYQSCGLILRVAKFEDIPVLEMSRNSLTTKYKKSDAAAFDKIVHRLLNYCMLF